MGFDYLKRLEIDQGATAPLELEDIVFEDGTCPKLKLRPAGAQNTEYLNERLRRSQRAPAILDTRKGPKDPGKDRRDRERPLFIDYIVVGWDNVRDSDTGEVVPFSEEKCAEFIYALPDWMFDEIYMFAGNPRNFTKSAVSAASVTEGNSPSGSSSS